MLIQNVVGCQPYQSSFETLTADASLLHRTELSGSMPRRLGCLCPARQILAPLSGKMANILELEEVLCDLAVSTGFKSTWTSSESLLVQLM